MASLMRSWLPWVTALSVIVFDRLTKLAILRNLAHGSWYEVFPGFTLTHVRNRGIAFSLFSDGGPMSRVVLHLVILTAVVVIAWMVVQHGRHHLLSGFAFGLILGQPTLLKRPVLESHELFAVGFSEKRFGDFLAGSG